MPGDHALTGSIAAFTALALVGTSFAASAMIASYPLAGGQALRYGLAAIVLLALARGRLPRPTLRQLALLAGVAAVGLAGFNAFVLTAFRHTDAANVGVVVGCVPVVLALAGPALARQRPSRRLVGAAVVVVGGAALVQWSGASLSAAGLALSIGALACEAGFTLIAGPVVVSLGPLAVSAYVTALAVPLLLAAGAIADGAGMVVLPSAAEAAALGYLAVIVTAGAFVLWYTGVRRLGAARAGLFAGIVPVSALLASAALGGASLTLPRAAGVAIVGAGLLIGVTQRAA